MNRLLRTIVWSASLGAALAALVRAGEPLPPPPSPLPDPLTTWRWVEHVDPAVAAFSIVRLGALVAVVYLLASTVLLTAAELSRAPMLIGAATRVTLPPARRLIQHVAGAGLAVSIVGAGSPLLAGASVVPAPRFAVVSSWSTTSSSESGPVPTAAPVPTPTGRPGAAPEPPPPVMQVIPEGPVLVHLDAARTTSPDVADPGAAGLPSDPGPSQPGGGAGSTATTTTTGATPGAPVPPDDPNPHAAWPGVPPTTTVPRATSDGPEPTATPKEPGPRPRLAPGPMTSLGPPGEPVAAAPPPGAVVGPPSPSDPSPPSPPSPPSEPSEPAGTVMLPSDGPAPRHHTIIAGDHLWGVAEQTLTTERGRVPDAAETLDYLHRLIDANRAVLAVTDDPDLVFPGQVFALPDTHR